MSDSPAAEVSAPDVPSGVTLVTNENFDEYVDGMLGTNAAPDESSEETPAADSPEAKAAEELKKVEAKKTEALQPKEGDLEGNKVFHKGKWVGKHDFSYRVHVQTEAKTKEAADQVAAAKAEAKTATEAREKAEQAASALKAKYEPPDTSELGAEPDPANYEDVHVFKKDLKEWTAKATRREDAAKAAQEQATTTHQQAVKAWHERIATTKTELPDYEAKINGSAVKVSDQMREAIFESEVGPKILYHFADNPDVAAEFGKMPTAKMLREFGKLEATLSGTEKQAPKASEIKPQRPLSEISRAPAPITPLKGANTPAGLKIDAEGNWTGTVDEFRAAHRAGKV